MAKRLDSTLRLLGIQAGETRTLFTSHATVREYEKGDIIFHEKRCNSTEYILIDGILHRYNATLQGLPVTTGFYQATAAITPHFARTIAGQSLFSMEALTCSVVAEISVEDLDRLRSISPELERFGARVVANELLSNLQEDVVNRSTSAKERLLLLRRRHPLLENLVPHSAIASYLGITNVSFSRLRSALSHE
ncbi:Crp/Fnr family transcriptional regulator [uncultured Acetobacteroides sp.]|uniref:Crp/Fnr family transcriptional regulator n=1 Tax=uncultured Acetobacteroides sp. TaxID=1760811 RepID=UPI0029F57C3C|nr:Crp/Fnr family transcriptional regulator [uncultured Acetobacteroides sp.]